MFILGVRVLAKTDDFMNVDLVDRGKSASILAISYSLTLLMTVLDWSVSGRKRHRSRPGTC